MTEFARQLSANDDIIFVYALFHSNDIWSTYIFLRQHCNSIKMQNSQRRQRLNLRTG